MKKSVVTVLLASLGMLVTGIAIGYLFDFLIPSLGDEYRNASLYRPWDDPMMYVFFLQPFVLSGALVWIWNKVKDRFKGTTGRKAINVTLIMFILTIIPGMLMTLSSFKVSLLAVLTWTISAFIQVLVASLIFIRMNR